VQEVGGADAVELADLPQRRGVSDPVLDPDRLGILSLLGQRDHLRRDVDAHHARGSPPAEQAGAHPVAAGQVENGKAGEVAEPGA
jgi:hypothetical protein